MQRRRRWMLYGGIVLALTACGAAQTADPGTGITPVGGAGAASPTEQVAAPTTGDEPNTEATAPTVEDTDTSSSTNDDAAAPTNPLCALATFPEVQAVIGGTISKVDVIDEQDLDYVDCIYLDQQDVYKSMSIRFTTTDKLVKTNAKWTNAAAYFAEWTRGAETVSGLGEGAAWVEISESLDVLKGETVVKFSSSSVEVDDPAVRTKMQELAQQIVPRLP